MGIVVFGCLIGLGYLLCFYCGTLGMILGIPISILAILADTEDLEFWRKKEVIEDDFF